MRPFSFEKLVNWILTEYKMERRIFGIEKEKIYRKTSESTLQIFGKKIASPIGPAAGPNSQLAQNIIASWLCGSRFIELKTVQKMDGEDLRRCIPRPCINAEDEGYNVEWSTELTVPEAFDEYAKAWLLVHILSKELDIPDGTQIVFNMSVGYDLYGIKTDKINNYIEGMKKADSHAVFTESIEWLKKNLNLFENVTIEDIERIPCEISDSVTLSTLHGCPPEEIERIASYLLEEKQVHTFIKCNPTLLGYDTARSLLDSMGYNYVSFDRHHFENDLQYPDAEKMLSRLQEKAKNLDLEFGVKITNTFPVKITDNKLPGEEMYMSGRALFPLSIYAARKLSKSFNGKLPISYSGGADIFNIEKIFKCGIRPITVATTILKPGGYERMLQLAQRLEPELDAAQPYIDVNALVELTDSLTALKTFKKEFRSAKSRKTPSALPLFDCFKAPCKNGGCPIEQQIPEYLKLVSEERYDEAFSVIAIDNTAPGITGTLCPHFCQEKCTRLDYDMPLQIRQAKLLASSNAQKNYVENLQPVPLKTDKKAVIIGAGPAGIASAIFLRRAGMAVTVLEHRSEPYGAVRYFIPEFRIESQVIQMDYELAVKSGVEFLYNVAEINPADLKKKYDYIVVAIGAWKESADIFKEGNEYTEDALAFLKRSKEQNCNLDIGKNVVVIGAGDVAADCARAARRAPNVDTVSIIYRRTRDLAPAEPEELEMAFCEGVKFFELLAPKKYDGHTLRLEKMRLDDKEPLPGQRRGVVPAGEETEVQADTVIRAVSARVDTSQFKLWDLELNSRNYPVLNDANESSIPDVYVIGDCKSGPATIVEAIADAKKTAADICQKENLDAGFCKSGNNKADREILYFRKGILSLALEDNSDGSRCLGCDSLCEICCDVCPNRANVRVSVPELNNSSQILHIDALCNECGNCGVFCPHTGNPYKDKFTVFSCKEDFENSENRGFLKLSADEYLIRLEDGTVFSGSLQSPKLPKSIVQTILAAEDQRGYLI